MRYVVLFACALLSLGCRNTEPQKSTAAPEYFKVDFTTAGKLTGTVRFTGKVPPAKPISMDAEEDCENLHKKPVNNATVIVGAGGTLANAVVYIKSGLEGKQFEPPKEAVVLDQRGCMFVPRVMALRTGQTLQVKNSDPVSHNIHPRPENNREWNQQMPPDSPDLKRRFARPEIMIPVRCNVHNWMRSWIAVLDHPWFAVTNDNGTFEWTGLPPGDYTLAVWHETLGELTHDVKLGPKGSETLAFTFSD